MSYPPASPPPHGEPHQAYEQPYNQPAYIQPILVQQMPTSGTATASMVLGILGLVTGICTFGIPCLIAVILGHAGLSATKDGARSGRGMAVAGLTMGYVALAPALLLSAIYGAGLFATMAGGHTSP